MEIKNFLKTKKAQMMSTAVLLMFMLMLAELFAFLIMSSNYSQLSTSRIISTGSESIGSSLASSSGQFAKSSLKAAILTLSEYEYNPSLRKGNFITNFSYDVSNLMISGTIPNATSYAQNSISQDMEGLTLSSYNQSVFKTFDLGESVKLNESRPHIYQSSPYSISVSYIENVKLNTSTGEYSFGIPVNATLNLTGLPDPYYAESGIWKDVKFGNIFNQVQRIGGIQADLANQYSFSYGTVYYLGSGSSCPANMNPLLANSTILVTENAMPIITSSCENNFGGLITESNTIPTNSKIMVPYLGYTPGILLSKLFQTGQGVLIYGPSYSAYNIQNLQKSVVGGYYFASPATASYIDRANGNPGTSSTQGIFTFSGYNRQSVLFNGVSSYLIAGNPASNSLLSPFVNNQITLSAWVFPEEGPYQQQTVLDFGTTGNSYCHAARLVVLDGNQWYGTVQNLNNGQSSFTASGLIPFSWNYITMTFSDSGSLNLYLNGQLEGSAPATVPLNNPNQVNNLVIGSNLGTATSGTSICGGSPKPFNGSIANVQVYNSTLTSSQIYSIYQQGYSGRPISGNSLVAWYPLNGNANDYSGNGNNANTVNTIFTDAPSGVPSRYASTFNGTSYIDSNITSYFGTNNAFTAAVWAYITPKTTGPVFGITGAQYFGVSYPTYNSMPLLFPVGLTLYNFITGNGPTNPPCYGGWCQASYTLPASGWYSLAVTYVPSGSGGTETLYIDGKATNQLILSEYNPANSVIGPTDFFTTDVQTILPGYSPYHNLTGSIANVQAYNTSLSPSQIMKIYTEGISGAPVQDKNLVTWLPLGGNANDYSGNTHPGIPTGGVPQKTSLGQNDYVFGPNHGIEYPLPGIGDCVNISSCSNASSHNIYASSFPILPMGSLQAASFSGTTDLYENISSYLYTDNSFSISMWAYIKPDTNGPLFGVTDSYPLEIGPGNGYNGIPWDDPILSTADTNVYASVSGVDQNNPIVADIGQSGWQYITLTYNSLNGGQTYLYINGQPTTTTPATGEYTGATPPSSGSSALPASLPVYWTTNISVYSGVPLPQGVNGLLQGEISNVQLYNTSLSQNQITSMYKGGIYSVPISYSNLIGWWPLQGNANDYSGNGYTTITDQNVTFPYISQNTSVTASIWQALGFEVPPK